MENSKTTVLLQTIKETLELYQKGELSFDTTKEEYKRILLEYKELEKKNKHYHTHGYLKGLLYHHNANNFSKLTVLFEWKKAELDHHSQNEFNKVFNEKTSAELRILDYYGDNKLLATLPELIREEIEKSFEISKESSRFFTAQPQKKFLFKEKKPGFSLFFNGIELPNKKLVIAAVTSSNYFKVNQFQYFCNLISTIYRGNRKINFPVTFDYFTALSSEIKQYINAHSNPGTAIMATSYVFVSLDKIFHQNDSTTMINLSNLIIKTLKNNTPEKSLVLALSLNSYLVLTPQEEHSAKKTINFHYNEIAIPYQVIHVTIDSGKSLYNLWEKLFIFENYVMGGDNP
ncbi:MAG: hypothetical protein GY754_32210 [bacterium]|nr:hypothetical protein [bacterium]